MLNLGNTSAKDFALGQNLVERIDFGSNVVFDPYSNVTGNLPLQFNSRVTANLKNYRLYGTASGSGVETENLFDKNAKDTNEGYIENQTLLDDGTTGNTPSFSVSEYIPISPNTDYYLTWVYRLSSNTSFCLYDSNKNYLSGAKYSSYGEVNGGTFNSGNAVYMRFSIRNSAINSTMLTEGSTAPASYIPYGYQIPLTVTSGETENLLEVTQENGFSYSSAYGNFTIENFKVYASGASLFGIWCKVKPNTTYTAKYSCTKPSAYPFRLREYTEKSDTWSGDKFIRQTEAYTNTVTATTTENTQYMLFTIYINQEQAPDTFYDMMLVEGSTAPSEYIPHRYTADYDLYIGDSKLGEEEYVDYGDEKVYKRAPNLVDSASYWNEYISGTIKVDNGATAQSSTAGYSTYYIAVEPNTEYTLNVDEIGSVGNRLYYYDANKNWISRSGSSDIPSTRTTPNNCYYVQIQLGATALNKNITFYQANLDPTDPPTPLPAITAYAGENTLSSTETVGEVTVRGRISPLLGTALTQANYDLITPVSTLYYPIYTTANGENIWTVKEVTAQEYAGLTSYDSSTLYLIMSGGNVEDAYVGSVECDKVYLGSTVVYEKVSYLLPDWFPQINIESYFAPYQSNSDYYFDAISANGALPNWSYYYERTYYQNPAQGEVNYNKTGTYTIQSYATWYTTSTSHKTVTLKVVNGDVENIQMTEESWTTNRQNLNGGNIEHQNNEAPWLIKQTMTTVNVTGNYTPELIGF